MYPFEHRKDPLSASAIIAGLILYFGIYFFCGPYILRFIAQRFDNVEKAYYYSEFIFYALMAAVMLVITRPIFEESDYNRIGHRKENFKYALKSLGLMYLSMFVLNSIIMMFNGMQTSANQQAIDSITKSYPVIMCIMSVVFAPVIEEVTFRGLIYRFVRDYNVVLAVLLSSVSFGLLHVFESLLAGNWLDLLFVVTYSVLGYFLTINYERSGSIYTNIGIHMTINAISMMIMFLGS